MHSYFISKSLIHRRASELEGDECRVLEGFWTLVSDRGKVCCIEDQVVVVMVSTLVNFGVF